MSDGDICSDDEKYGGFGAAMAYLLVFKSKSKLSGLVHVSCWCCCWYAGGGGGAASFFLAMDNGEFNNGGGGAATDSGYSGSSSKGTGAFNGGGIV